MNEEIDLLKYLSENTVFKPIAGCGFVRKLIKSFPEADIKSCIKSASDWLVSHPSQKYSSYERFLMNWIRRENKTKLIEKARAEVVKQHEQKKFEQQRQSQAKKFVPNEEDRQAASEALAAFRAKIKNKEESCKKESTVKLD